MKYVAEILLAKKNVGREEWAKLVERIAEYVGEGRKWKLLVACDEEIRYFVEVGMKLPIVLTGVGDFWLKEVENDGEQMGRGRIRGIYWGSVEENVVRIAEKLKLKKDETMKRVEMEIGRMAGKMWAWGWMEVIKEGKRRRRVVIPLDVVGILAVDFEGNKKYFYKSVPKYLEIKKILSGLKREGEGGLLEIETLPYRQGKWYLGQNEFSFDKHTMVLGASGCGKSKFVCKLIENVSKSEDLKEKYRFVVIDPHAALVEEIGEWAKVVDFETRESGMDLFAVDDGEVNLTLELLMELFRSLLGNQHNAKLDRVLRFAVWLLLLKGEMNLGNLLKVVLDLEYRNEMMESLGEKLPVMVEEFFARDFNDLKTRSYGEAIAPIVSFVDEMGMIPALVGFSGGGGKVKSMEEMVQENPVTLFSLNQTKLGKQGVKMLAGLLMQQILGMVMRRNEKKIILVVDEVAVVENAILQRILAEARKYNLSVILAGQFWGQITEELRAAILANVVNYFVFRVSKMDAEVLADVLDMKIPIDDTRERKVKMLTSLKTRECVMRVERDGELMTAKGRTLDFTSRPGQRMKVKMKQKEEEEGREKREFKVGKGLSLMKMMRENTTNDEEDLEK